MKRKSNKARLTNLTSSAGWNCGLSMKRMAKAFIYCLLILLYLIVCHICICQTDIRQSGFFFLLREEEKSTVSM